MGEGYGLRPGPSMGCRGGGGGWRVEGGVWKVRWGVGVMGGDLVVRVWWGMGEWLEIVFFAVGVSSVLVSFLFALCIICGRQRGF